MSSIGKNIEITAQSSESFQGAINAGLERARKTLVGVQSAWIKDQQVSLGSDGTPSYRVTMKITFLMEE